MATEIRVCFKNKLKSTWLTVGADNADEARRIAKTWGERTENEPVIRTILKQHVATPRGRPETVDGINVWPAAF